MTIPHAVLIERLRRRNADRKVATDGGIHPRQAVPPIGAKALNAVEVSIGFKLPESICSLYRSVGNGGFGPQYGIVGTMGGAKLDGCTLETCYEQMLQLQSKNSTWRWPRRLLPLANYGCGMWSCVDCTYARLRMILWDPSDLDENLDRIDARRNWGNAFWDLRLSLNAWLEGWLAGHEEPQPVPPSQTWIRKRLGFTLNSE